jgi:hypothetical protein
MIKITEFNVSRARSFRKRMEVLAFRSEDPMCFRKPWGEQDVRAGGWIIVPLADTGNVTQDVYGIDAQIFSATYEPSPSLRPNQFRKIETILAYQPGEPFEVDTVLKDGHTEVKSSSTDSHDAWIVQAPDGETYPVENTEFRRTYVENLQRENGYRIKSCDQHWAADGKPKRILSLDGGGVRGVLTLGYLERIEQLLRERHGDSQDFRLCHYFDLIAGTSTGAIIAAYLAKGRSVKEVQEKYRSLAGSVFKRNVFRRGILRPRYSVNRLKNILKELFEKNTMGSLSIQTGLLIVAKRLDTGSIWPMSNNPGNRFFSAKSQDEFFSNEDYPLCSVVRASTAAPSYFAPEFIEISKKGERPHGFFVDGGASPHNNPALLALQLVTVKGFGACWKLDPDKIFLMSVGTGSAQPGTVKSMLAGAHAINSLLSVMDDCAESVESILQWLSNSPTARQIDEAMGDLGQDLLAERPLLQYIRYNVQLESKWLKENLGKDISSVQARSLKEMDNPQNIGLLYDIGILAASRQVREDHFPPEFDID